jgi:hypothetical protein
MASQEETDRMGFSSVGLVVKMAAEVERRGVEVAVAMGVTVGTARPF